MTKRIGIWLLCLGILALAVLLVLPNISRMSSGGMQAKCLAQIAALAHALKEYANENGGSLPHTLDQLSSDYASINMRCPFHSNSSEFSYYYIPQEPIQVSDGAIILYCQGQHPSEVVSCDGDRSPGVVPAILRDFRVVRLHRSQIALQCQR